MQSSTSGAASQSTETTPEGETIRLTKGLGGQFTIEEEEAIFCALEEQ